MISVRLLIWALAAIATASVGSAARAAEHRTRIAGARSGRMRTVGLYVWKDSPAQHDFWKACGINLLQFCDTHWSIRRDLLDPYYASLAADIDRARRDGFRVTVLLFSNIAQWQGPGEREPSGMGILFDPRDPVAMQARLADLTRAIRALKRADGFTLLGGDPGGAVGASFGAIPASEWMRLARLTRDVVRREAPHAEFNVNPWAIAYWQCPNLGCGVAEWWLRETDLTRSVLAEPDLVGRDVGVEIPPHFYYRALALRCASQAGIRPDPCPNKSDVAMLRDRGVGRLLAWPYFLLDEADDGDVGPDGNATRSVQIDTRYIHRLVAEMRGLGLDGAIGSWSYDGHLARALNTYAFGRFCGDRHATPGGVIDEYARCVADDATWRLLAQVLRFVEGQSNWHRKLPPERRLPTLPCALKTAAEALEALETVEPRERPTFPLAEPASTYLQRLRVRLRRVGDGR